MGASVRAPFYIAPMAYHGDLHPEGEIAAARAAAGAGVLAIFSTLSSRPLEEIAKAAPGGTRWFQLYRQPAWAQSEELVRRAERAGYAAIVLTADVPVLAVRDRQAAGGFAIDSGRTLGNGPHIRTPPRTPEGSGGVYRIRPDDGGDWSVVDRLRETTELPVLVKGILHPDDAAEAVAHGAKGVIVSNHGGRQLDGALPAIDALPAVVAAVGGRAEVLVEGGFRRAADLLVARALGARAVGIGRPILWSLLLGGTAGIAEYLRLLEAELANAMALCGVATMEEVDARLLST